MDTTLHDAVHRVAHQPARPPRALDPTLPVPLASILTKATAMKAGDRYASAAEFAADLGRWLDGQAVSATPPTMWRKATAWAGRHPFVFAAVGSIGIFTLAGLGFFSARWWFDQKPVSIQLIDGGHRNARLLARSGNILHEWGDGTRDSVTFASLAERPAEWGGGKVAVLGLSLLGPPQLCAFNADQPDVMLWTSGFGPEAFEIPPLDGFSAPASFSIRNAYVLDMFPESPGSEIVALHLHKPWGITAIRIYDLNGNILYEAWHNGHLHSAYWLNKPGLLVLAGVNSEVFWKCRGHPEAKAAWPSVVLAIKPVLGQKRGWITTPSQPGDLAPIWYRCVFPPEALPPDVAPVQLARPEDVGLAASDQFVLKAADTVCLICNSDGVVTRTIVMATQRQERGPGLSERPAIESIYLGDLSPIDAGAGAECRPENN